DIQLLHDGIWGHICLSSPAPETIGKVLCRQLGEDGTNGQIIQMPGDYKWAGEGPVWYHQLHCYGNESHIQQCKHNEPVKKLYQTHCPGTKISTLICQKIPLNLKSTNTAVQFGYVEANIVKRWHPLCKVNIHAARLICQGYVQDPNYARFRYIGIQRESYNLLNYTAPPININCKGKENTIEECQIKSMHMTFHTSYIPTGSDVCPKRLVQVQCPTAKNLIVGFEFRLEDSVRGLLLTKAKNETSWIPVCATRWSYNNSRVLCRSMGYDSKS
ncbi:unnamed protein product, partial [Owenia fusiformis]